MTSTGGELFIEDSKKLGIRISSEQVLGSGIIQACEVSSGGFCNESETVCEKDM